MSFKEDGYLVIKNLIEPDEVTRLYEYTLSREYLGNQDDGQVPGSASFYEDEEVVKLQNKILPLIEAHINIPLQAVYCYHRVYRKGAILRTHKDSVRNEISATINIGQMGPPWDLWFLDYNENPQKVVLTPGDALIYRGMELAHWRGKLEQSDKVSQFMFGFIDKKGSHRLIPLLEVITKLRKKWRELFGIKY